MLSYDDMLKSAREQVPDEILNAERLEIPKLKSIVIGNKTEITNFGEVAGIIRREVKMMMKYMTRELGSAGVLEGRKAIFNGKFGGIMINEKFDKYLEEYVMCKECGKPDTSIATENRQWFLKCEACGARRSIAKLK